MGSWCLQGKDFAIEPSLQALVEHFNYDDFIFTKCLQDCAKGPYIYPVNPT